MHYMHGSSGSSLACYLLLVTLDVFELPRSLLLMSKGQVIQPVAG